MSLAVVHLLDFPPRILDVALHRVGGWSCLLFGVKSGFRALCARGERNILPYFLVAPTFWLPLPSRLAE